MKLPIRFGPFTPEERLLCADGAWGARGLELSHWPGNRTPSALRHELSTGIALAFARLPAAEQLALAQGCTALANNHYDTDGTCSLFVLAHPEQALALERPLLEAAAAGDFFQVPSEQAFVIDVLVQVAVDPERSPWASELRGLSDFERYRVATEHVHASLPRWLAGDTLDQEPLYRPALERLRADRAALARAMRDELVHLDFTIWTAAAGETTFDPGRHALFGSTTSDRLLVLAPGPAGTRCRLLIGTHSWFDLPGVRAQPRPELERLCARLNELEGSAPEHELAWRCQGADGPSPELWFGLAEHERFAEHAGPVLAPSALETARLKALVLEALRAAWVFPEEEDAPLYA